MSWTLSSQQTCWTEMALHHWSYTTRVRQNNRFCCVVLSTNQILSWCKSVKQFIFLSSCINTTLRFAPRVYWPRTKKKKLFHCDINFYRDTAVHGGWQEKQPDTSPKPQPAQWTQTIGQKRKALIMFRAFQWKGRTADEKTDFFRFFFPTVVRFEARSLVFVHVSFRSSMSWCIEASSESSFFGQCSVSNNWFKLQFNLAVPVWSDFGNNNLIFFPFCSLEKILKFIQRRSAQTPTRSHVEGIDVLRLIFSQILQDTAGKICPKQFCFSAIVFYTNESENTQLSQYLKPSNSYNCTEKHLENTQPHAASSKFPAATCRYQNFLMEQSLPRVGSPGCAISPFTTLIAPQT